VPSWILRESVDGALARRSWRCIAVESRDEHGVRGTGTWHEDEDGNVRSWTFTDASTMTGAE
jgi:hypothetical protein